MNLKIFYFVLFICSFSFIINKTEAEIGDVIWHICGDVSRINIKNACVSLIEAERCNLNVSVTIQGKEIFKKSFNVGIIPEVCGTYNIGDDCEFCAIIKDNPSNSSQECLVGTGKCPFTSFPSYSVGCFPKTIFSEILICRESQCINECSSNGNCINGSCVCDHNWYGIDCSSVAPIYEKCIQVNELAGKVCVQIKIQDCQVIMEIFSGGLPILTRNFPISQFNSIMSQPLCSGSSDKGCETCLTWNNLILNNSMVSTCGNINFKCFSQDYGTYSLDCFSSNISPKCFLCPNNCSEHGICFQGTCSCSSDYNGDDCSNYKGQKDSGTLSSKAVMVIVPIFIILGLVGIAAIVWFFSNKRSQKSSFERLDLFEDTNDELKETELNVTNESSEEENVKNNY